MIKMCRLISSYRRLEGPQCISGSGSLLAILEPELYDLPIPGRLFTCRHLVKPSLSSFLIH
jgi:hypothetical protein